MEEVEGVDDKTSRSQSRDSRRDGEADGFRQKIDDVSEPSLDEKTAQASHGDAGHPDDMKKEAILDACRRGDLGALRAFAESPGGFLDDSIRQRACKCSLYQVLTHSHIDCSQSLRADTPGTPTRP